MEEKEKGERGKKMKRRKKRGEKKKEKKGGGRTNIGNRGKGNENIDMPSHYILGLREGSKHLDCSLRMT